MFNIILNISIVVIIATSFDRDFEQAVAIAVREEQYTEDMISDLTGLKNHLFRINVIAERYKKTSIYLYVSDQEKLWVNLLPQQINVDTSTNLTLLKENQTHYLVVANNLTVKASTFRIIFAKDISYLYQKLEQHIVIMLGASVIINVIIGFILFIMMKKIYRPISNIAHELRTPLTNIHGYAQYMMSGNITEADKLFANQYILKESGHMSEIVERLLVMGSLRDGRIHLEQVKAERLFTELARRFPMIKIENDMVSFYGDASLMLSLLSNLITNALQVADQVKVFAEVGKITVWNDGTVIKKDVLSKMNKNQDLDQKLIYGNGFGLHICHEIAKLHKGTLKFDSSVMEGTRAVVSLK
jgi:signal transduction histidine kinase